jgi:uncharacterized protein YjbJ (UPF0337 family)
MSLTPACEVYLGNMGLNPKNMFRRLKTLSNRTTRNETKISVNKLEIKGDRNILKGKLKQMGAKLTDDKLQYVEGKSVELLGKLQKHTGEIREAVKESASGRCE